MELEETLAGRLRLWDIRKLCEACAGNDAAKAELFLLACGTDDRVAYNALWIFSHFRTEDLRWLAPRRNELIDTLLGSTHPGRCRLLLHLLEHLPAPAGALRTDYLDFCLSNINSTRPYAIRAFCLRQAFECCRHYPELMAELKTEIELMDLGPLSPGLLSARRNILRKISRL